MEDKKVLIACPIGDGKEYSINEWLQWIAENTYQNYEVCLCVNGKTDDSIRKKVRLLEMCEIKDHKINVLSLPFREDYGIKQRLTLSREKIRQFAAKGAYDYILWLDSDTIPVLRDALPMLMDQHKEIISGLYFYKGSRQSVIIDLDTNANMKYEKIEGLIQSGEVVKVWGFGFGIVLMERSIFEKFPFDYTRKYENWTEDFVYCEDVEKAGTDRWLYARVICKHYHKREFNVKDAPLEMERKE